MSPVPIIERQRGLAEAGQIRCGDEKRVSEKGKSLVGKKLETFRLTSQHRDLIDAASEEWGGEVKSWESPEGPAWQVVTAASALPCLIVVNYSLSLMYERWEGATKATRRCDGVTESLAGVPCVCNAEGKEECDIVTRLMVVLPELGTTLGWKLRSIGENAARELAGSMELANGMAGGRPFVPAILRLTQRRSVDNGQTLRYVVPVLDLQMRGLLDAAPTTRQLEPGRTSVAAALAETDRRSDEVRRTTARSQAPIGSGKAPPPSTGGGRPTTEVGAPSPEPEPLPLEPSAPSACADKAATLIDLADQLGIGEAVREYVKDNRKAHKADDAAHETWLDDQIALAESKLVSETAAAS